MRKLDPYFRFDSGLLESRLKSIAEELAEREFDRDLFRKRLKEEYAVGKLRPEAKEASFLCVDASIVKKELRHHALWGTHAVTLYSRFDGNAHPDPLAQGNIGYSEIQYESSLDLGVFWPYKHVESRANSARVAAEYSSLLASLEKLGDAPPDFLLIDGSLQTTFKKLRSEAKKSRFPEHRTALESHMRLVGAGKVVGMVEDSHSTDISKKLGLDVTNIALLELLLEEGEYICEEKDNVQICHLKLPRKRLSYIQSGVSGPLTVRWEFSYPGFEEDLDLLAGLWLLEDDIWHPQIYPIRVADFLTRKVKLGSVLDSLIAENGLEGKYRDMRQS